MFSTESVRLYRAVTEAMVLTPAHDAVPSRSDLVAINGMTQTEATRTIKRWFELGLVYRGRYSKLYRSEVPEPFEARSVQDPPPHSKQLLRITFHFPGDARDRKISRGVTAAHNRIAKLKAQGAIITDIHECHKTDWVGVPAMVEKLR